MYSAYKFEFTCASWDKLVKPPPPPPPPPPPRPLPRPQPLSTRRCPHSTRNAILHRVRVAGGRRRRWFSQEEAEEAVAPTCLTARSASCTKRTISTHNSISYDFSYEGVVSMSALNSRKVSWSTTGQVGETASSASSASSRLGLSPARRAAAPIRRGMRFCIG